MNSRQKITAVERSNAQVENPCLKAAFDAAQEILRENPDATEAALRAATVAYRAALPLMMDRDSIRLYIASVAEGVATKVFTGTEAAKLLYAAQVALAALGKDEANAKFIAA